MKVALKFEKRDVWIGVYWRIEPLMSFSERKPGEKIPDFVMDAKLHEIYICIVPMLPIKLSWIKSLAEPVMVRPATLDKAGSNK